MLWVLLLSLISNAQAAKKPVCDIDDVLKPTLSANKLDPDYRLTKLDPDFQLAYLNSEKPILLSSNPKSMLTYSFDGEFRDAELMKWLKKDPEAWAEVKSLFKDENFTKEKLRKIFDHLSEKQFDLFVMGSKAPVPKGTVINLTDLPPTYIEALTSQIAGTQSSGTLKLKITNTKRFSELAKIVEKKLKKSGLDIRGFQDGNALEINHSTFETVPQLFRKQLNFVDERFPKSTFHGHIGLLASEVSEPQLQSIGRATECKIIINLATVENPAEIPGFMMQFTTLTSNENLGNTMANRGLVKIQGQAFGDGVTAAHDFEVRQAESIAQLEELMDFGSELAVKRKNLIYTEEGLTAKFPGKFKDPYTVNLPYTLGYLGKLMLRKTSPELQRIGKELESFSKEMIKKGVIEDSMRKKVRQFLIKNNVESKLDSSLFLE